jgi:hypothetical protein
VSEADREALLRRFAPHLVYDSNEAFFADSAAEWTDNPMNCLRRYGERGEPGEVLAAATPAAGQEQLSLDFLGHPTYRNGAPYQKGDAISDPKRNYRAQYVTLRQKPGYKNRIYGRVREDASARLWLQYWFFYFYNDYNLAGGIGLHEGDWEMVQLRMYGDEPDLAVYAQHRWAERRTWDEVERLPANADTPVVYVARGSHASYFRAGYHETEAWYDMADGRRPAPKLELEFIGDIPPPWATWPGRWGDTGARRGGIDQPSPTSPCAHKQWDDPKRLLEDSREPAHGKALAPPEVDVRRHDGRLAINYDFSARTGSPPHKLVVTVNSVDDKLPPRTFTFSVEGALRGQIETRLVLSDTQHYDVYVSMTDSDTKPSASKLTMLQPLGQKQRKGLPLLPLVGRLVARLRGAFRERPRADNRHP